MSSMPVTAYWLEKEFLGHGTRSRNPARALWSPWVEKTKLRVYRNLGAQSMSDGTWGERISWKENCTDKQKASLFSTEQSAFVHRKVRKPPKAEERTFKWIRKDGAQCPHRARNITRSHQPDWKNSWFTGHWAE